MSEGDFVNAKKVAWGAICTSSKPHSAPPRQQATEHSPDVPFWSGISAGTAQVQYWSLLRDRGKEDDENQCDASTTHRALNSLISININ
jgi:hypothetical protein